MLLGLSRPAPPLPQPPSSELTEGYPPDLFLTPVDNNFICPFCGRVCRNAESSSCCGQLLCKGCVERWFSQRSTTCPACRSSPSTRSSFSAQSFADRQIRALPIRCPIGCGAETLVIGLNEQSLNEHTTLHCPLRLIPCQHGCGVRFRPDQAAQHEPLCVNNSVLCPNSCFESRAQQLHNHSSSSPSPAYLPSGGVSSERPVVSSNRPTVSQPSVGEFSVGQRVDVRDRQGRGWSEGEVLQVSPSTVLIHYEGMDKQHNEWRLKAHCAPLHTHTPGDAVMEHASPLPPPTSSTSSPPSPSPHTLVPTRILRTALTTHLILHCPNTIGQCSACHQSVKRHQLVPHRSSVEHRLHRAEVQLKGYGEVMAGLLGEMERKEGDRLVERLRRVMEGSEEETRFIPPSSGEVKREQMEEVEVTASPDSAVRSRKRHRTEDDDDRDVDAR